MANQFEDKELKRLQRERAQDEEFRRRVREEIRRVESGEAKEAVEEDIAREEAQREEALKVEQRRKKRESNPFWLLISGNVLLHDSVRRGYRYLFTLALLFFLSIVTMFTSLHLDLRYGKLSEEIYTLREKSLRLQSQCFSKSSHYEISRQLKERGVNISDPTKPRTIVK